MITLLAGVAAAKPRGAIPHGDRIFFSSSMEEDSICGLWSRRF
jgi:hypothetical protein